MLTAIVVTLIALLAIILGWHWLFIGAVAITAAVWGVVVTSVIVLSVAILLLFVLTGASIFIIGGIAFIWTVLAIVLFPVLFPVLAPLFIIFLFVSYIRRRKKINVQ